MANVVATHAVSNMDAWLAGSHNRSRLFSQFCSSYRLYRHPEQSMVTIVFEDANLEKMQSVLESPEAAAAKAEDTVVDPIQIFVELDGAR